MVKLTGTLGLHFETWQTVPSDSSVLIFVSTQRCTLILKYNIIPCIVQQRRVKMFMKMWVCEVELLNCQVLPELLLAAGLVDVTDSNMINQTKQACINSL